MVGRRQCRGLHGIGRCAARMGSHMGHACRLTRRSGRGNAGWVANLPGCCMGSGGQGADRSDAHVAAGEGSQAVDGLTRAGVARCLGLE